MGHKRKGMLFFIIILPSPLYCNQPNLISPVPFVFHPDCCESVPRQCIHQAVTTARLTFVPRMCKRTGGSQCSHSGSSIMVKPSESQPEGQSLWPYVSKYVTVTSSTYNTYILKPYTKPKLTFPHTFPWIVRYFIVSVHVRPVNEGAILNWIAWHFCWHVIVLYYIC